MGLLLIQNWNLQQWSLYLNMYNFKIFLLYSNFRLFHYIYQYLCLISMCWMCLFCVIYSCFHFRSAKWHSKWQWQIPFLVTLQWIFVFIVHWKQLKWRRNSSEIIIPSMNRTRPLKCFKFQWTEKDTAFYRFCTEWSFILRDTNYFLCFDANPVLDLWRLQGWFLHSMNFSDSHLVSIFDQNTFSSNAEF